MSAQDIMRRQFKKNQCKKNQLLMNFSSFTFLICFFAFACSHEGPDAFTVTENPKLVIPKELSLPKPEQTEMEDVYQNAQNKVREIILEKKIK